jgi:hypothetical protein
MYFWNTVALARELKSKSLSQSERMKYYLASSTLYTFIYEINGYFNTSPSLISIVQSVATIVATVIGITLCYRVNARGDGQEFIDRFVCLSWPILMRIIVGFSLFYLIYYLSGTIIGGDRFEKFNESTTSVDVLLSLFFEAVFYWRVACHLQWASRSTEI